MSSYKYLYRICYAHASAHVRTNSLSFTLTFQRYLHSPDAASNCDRDVQNALLILRASQDLLGAGPGPRSAKEGRKSNKSDVSSMHTFPWRKRLKQDYQCPTPIPPNSAVSDTYTTVMNDVAVSESCEDDHHDLDLGSTGSICSSSVDLVIKDMTFRAKLLLARQNELVQVR